MTSALGFGSLPFLLESASNWSMVERLFERNRVPLTVIEHPQHRIPLAAMVRLFEGAGEIVGDRAFGLRVGQRLSHKGYGIWARHVSSASSLSGALRRSSETIHFHQTGARISLTISGKYTVWSYHRPAVSVGAGMHHSDHVLPSMIDLVRSYLGPGWIPAWVELDYSDCLRSAELADGLQADTKFGQPAIGIAIRSDQLSAQPISNLPARKIVTLAELRAHNHWRADYGLVGAICDIINVRLLEGKSDLEGTAECLHIGPRTLQRALKAEGCNYKSLVKNARHQRALFLLRESRASISEIAASLGYEETANFTRAFRQWASVPPSALRR